MRENKEKQALADLMIKPVQRIPRYELLVKVSLQCVRVHRLSEPRACVLSILKCVCVCVCVVFSVQIEAVMSW